MAQDKQENVEKGIHNIESALGRTEQFIEDNRNPIMYAVGAIALLIAIFFGVKHFVISPKEKEAESAIFMAQRYFEEDSFRLALDGDGANIGFIELINSYGITKTANLARYYAGISLLKTGEYEEAIKYLKKFHGHDKLVAPIAHGALGDANLELGNDKEAISDYLKAAKMSDNAFTSPIFLMKAAQVYEKINDYAGALKVYEQIKKDFPNSTEGNQIDKYIERAKLKI